LLTQGRYAFAAPGARHLPFFHPFGSKNWTKGEYTGNETIGEKIDAKQIYFGGGLPENPPPQNVVGRGDNFAVGFRYPLDVLPAEQVIGGFPRKCWGRFQPIPVLTSGGLNVNDRAVQAALAGVILEMYTNVPAAADILQTILDRPATFTTHPSNGDIYPGIIIARTNAYNVVLIGGALEEQQKALAALYAVTPMRNFGYYSCNLYFQVVANFVLTQMLSAGLDPTLPTLIGGHSMGGIVAQIVAIRMKQANVSTDVRGITYGAPRGGDSRLRTLTAGMPWVSIVNEGDPIPNLPPVFSEWYPFSTELAAEFQITWRSWVDSPNRVCLDVNGVSVAPSRMELTVPFLLQAVAAVGEGPPFPVAVAHGIAEYVRRLNLP